MGFIFVIVLVLFVVVVVGYLVGVYNQLIGVRVNVDRSWSNIEILEKQRYDEIPRLVKVCEGYMQYERETLEKVIAARIRPARSRFMKEFSCTSLSRASCSSRPAMRRVPSPGWPAGVADGVREQEGRSTSVRIRSDGGANRGMA